MPAWVPMPASVGDWLRSIATDEPGSPSSALARPKSRSFTVPAGVTFTFAGFRSRWMIPRSWASSRASAICRAMPSASSSGTGPRASRSASVSPSTSSITSARRPSDSSSPWIAAMLGWLSDASTCASRLKRTMRSGSLAKTSGSTLIATSRCSLVSEARYTSPMPPWPIFSRMR